MPSSRQRGNQAQLPLHLIDQPGRGELACGETLAGLLSEAIARAGKSRQRVAAEMGDYLGCSITVAQLNAWTAVSKAQHRFPAEYLGALCFATGDPAPLELLAQQARMHIVGAGAMAQLQVLSIDDQLRSLKARKRELLAIAQVGEAGR